MAKSALNISVKLEGAQETFAAFRRLPKDATKELREKSLALAQSLVSRIQSAAASDTSPQAALFGPTVRPKRDRIPAIQAGGARRVGRNAVPVWGVLFGGEFGSNRFGQFGKPHSGRTPSGPLFGVAERESGAISKAWNDAADGIVERFAEGGP